MLGSNDCLGFRVYPFLPIRKKQGIQRRLGQVKQPGIQHLRPNIASEGFRVEGSGFRVKCIGSCLTTVPEYFRDLKRFRELPASQVALCACAPKASDGDTSAFAVHIRPKPRKLRSRWKRSCTVSNFRLRA